jgi:LacI family transcriptional regulator
MAVSQRSLAEELNLSQVTVCRVLRGMPGVGEDVRRRVLSAARKSGYPVAARFRKNRAALQHVVCSIIPVQPGRDASDFHVRLFSGIEQGVREAGAELVNLSDPPANWAQTEAQLREWPRIVARRQVDGVIHQFGGDETQKPNYTCPVPHVSIFCPVDENSDTVTVDNIGGARAVGAHLGALGHRRVAYIGPTTPLADDRLHGLRMGLKAQSGAIPDELVVQAAHAGTLRDAADLLQRLLPPDVRDPAALRARFTAIAVYNDWMAIGVITELTRLGLRVPADISVTGFDNVPQYGYSGPALTTAAMPLEALGLEAARLLYSRIDQRSGPRRTVVLDAALVKGETAGLRAAARLEEQ